MNKISFSGFNPSIYPIILIFQLLFFFNSPCCNAQSVIYKSDGNIIKATHISKYGGTRSYQLVNDTSGIVYYIMNSALDSIRYEDGTIEKFFSNILLPDIESVPEKLRKNTLGFNIWPLFSSNIEIFYDRLFLNNQLGFKNCLLISTIDKNPYGSYYSMINYSVSSGFNYYFLQSYLFRFGTGVAFAFGQFTEEFYESAPDYSYVNYYIKNENHSGVFLNASLTSKIQKVIFISIEFDVPLFWTIPYNSLLIKTEIGINF